MTEWKNHTSTLFLNLSSLVSAPDHTENTKQHGPLSLRSMPLLVLHRVTKAQVMQE